MPKLTIYGILANFRMDKKNNSVNFEPNKNLSSSFVSLIKRSILAKGIRNWVNFVTTYNFVQKSWGLSVVHHRALNQYEAKISDSNHPIEAFLPRLMAAHQLLSTLPQLQEGH